MGTSISRLFDMRHCYWNFSGMKHKTPTAETYYKWQFIKLKQNCCRVVHWYSMHKMFKFDWKLWFIFLVWEKVRGISAMVPFWFVLQKENCCASFPVFSLFPPIKYILSTYKYLKKCLKRRSNQCKLVLYGYILMNNICICLFFHDKRV